MAGSNRRMDSADMAKLDGSRYLGILSLRGLQIEQGLKIRELIIQDFLPL